MAYRDLKDANPVDKAESLAKKWFCELCGEPIAPQRVARAISRGHRPRFCRPVAEHLSEKRLTRDTLLAARRNAGIS